MKKIKVEDRFKISDRKSSPVKGVVCLKTEDGRILFKKNNLVVNDGRKIIKELFLTSLVEDGYGSGAVTDTVPLQKYYSPSIIIGSGVSSPTDGDTVSTFSSASGNTLKIISGKANITLSSSETTASDIYIKFSTSINGSGITAENMSELGIGLLQLQGDSVDIDGSNITGLQKSAYDSTAISQIKLFSRIVFDALPLTSDNTYILDYYLYF